MKLGHESKIPFFVFAFVATIALSSCSSNSVKTGENRNSAYCRPGDRLGTCILRDTYRRVVNLFPD